MKYMASMLLLVTVVIISMFSGRYPVSLDDTLKILTLQLQDENVKVFLQVMMNMRLTGIIAAMVVGSSLSVSGSVCQGIFCNPMVSPALPGIAFSAALGILTSLIGVPFFIFIIIRTKRGWALHEAGTEEHQRHTH